MGRVVEVDQSPIGRTPRSNPATYTEDLRPHPRSLRRAARGPGRGFGKGRFSFNVAGGRCETCQGAGLLQIGMHFLGDVDVVCPDCEGRRFNDETLAVQDRGKNIHDVLEMSVDEAAAFYAGEPRLAADLEVLERLGLGYLKLGQSSTTLSGRRGPAGQARRRDEPDGLAGRVLYVLEEPTTGLHRADVENLLAALQGLVDLGRTIIAVEHHPDVIRAADRVVDLGPGERRGGRPCRRLRHARRDRGLRPVADGPGPSGRIRRGRRRAGAPGPGRRPDADGPIVLEGVSTHNLRGIDVRIPFRKFTAVCGPSGGGKSSLAFDTLFAASRQRYIESFSAYVRAAHRQGRAGRLRRRPAGSRPPIAVGRGPRRPRIPARPSGR